MDHKKYQNNMTVVLKINNIQVRQHNAEQKGDQNVTQDMRYGVTLKH